MSVADDRRSANRVTQPARYTPRAQTTLGETTVGATTLGATTGRRATTAPRGPAQPAR